MKLFWSLAIFCLALCLNILPAMADVSGSLHFNTVFTPINTQTEAVVFDIDLQTNLLLNVTLSGLTLGFDLGFGATGVEFAILNLSTHLGALRVSDQFVFAAPFYNSSTIDPILPNEIHRTRDQVGNVNGPAFVKKRISLMANIAGLTVKNLAIFEDVDFPNPFLYINPVYNTGRVDHSPDTGHRGLANQTPSYGFGDVFTLSGHTLSGISLSHAIGLCAGLTPNVIKKRDWSHSVNSRCAAPARMETNQTLFAFDFASLNIDNVGLGALTLDAAILWKPQRPIVATLTAVFSLFDSVSVTASLGSSDIATLTLDTVQVTAQAEHLTLIALDATGDLRFDLTDVQLSLILNPNHNPATLNVHLVHLAQAGVVWMQTTLTVQRGPLAFESASSFSDTGANTGTIHWALTTFKLDLSGNALGLGATVTFAPGGMASTTLNVAVHF